MPPSPFELDERGVETLSIHYNSESVGKRKDKDEEAVDDEHAHQDKRMRSYEDCYPSNHPQAYDGRAPSGSGFSNGATGVPSCYPLALQYPQEAQYLQGMRDQMGIECAYIMQEPSVLYQQTMDHGCDMTYPSMSTSAYGLQHTTMSAGYDVPPTCVPSAMPWDMPPPPPTDFSQLIHGGADLSYVRSNDSYPDGHNENVEDGNETDGNDVMDDADADEGPDTGEDSNRNDNDEEEMEDPSDKAKGKRPEWGAPTSVHEGSVSALVYSADGRHLASGSEDATIIIWDALNKNARYRVPLHGDVGHTTDTVYALAFSRDNMHLVSASYDEEVIIWTVANGRGHLRLSPGCTICALAYTPDGKYLVGGAGDGTLHLWDAQTYELARTLTAHETAITFILFSPDGCFMATGGTESVCCVWRTADLLDGTPLCVLEGHRGMVCAAAFAPDGRRIATASDDSSSRIWNTRTGEALVLMHEHAGPVWTVVFSPDGRRVASGSSDATVKICDSYTGERVRELGGQDGMVNAVAFSPDGRLVASAASDSTVRLWDAADGAHRKTCNEHDDNVTSVMFASDGSTLASGSHDGTVRIRVLMAA
uniref:Cercosporin MFS transporter CTB4 (Cercosporin toxin biosynthesis cluster protein 4) n=1 Tax=Ganoderma boninense TaxID=34458 RepID=A0A5K1K160_9APHY|nr:Cercosporin MFS transporter CTB4 (Cercosporin toxin biosynthesis cluster protein 4) [Ganoderma boninense]